MVLLTRTVDTETISRAADYFPERLFSLRHAEALADSTRRFDPAGTVITAVGLATT